MSVPSIPSPEKLNVFLGVSNKAVADGAVSFFLDHFVGVRVSKHDYGIGIGIPFEPNNDEHRRRESQSFISLSGEKRLNGYFDIILAKVMKQVPLSLSLLNLIHCYSEHPSLGNPGV